MSVRVFKPREMLSGKRELQDWEKGLRGGANSDEMAVRTTGDNIRRAQEEMF